MVQLGITLAGVPTSEEAPMRDLIRRETQSVAGVNDTLEVYFYERGWLLRFVRNGAESRSYLASKWQHVEHAFLAFRHAARSYERLFQGIEPATR